MSRPLETVLRSMKSQYLAAGGCSCVTPYEMSEKCQTSRPTKTVPLIQNRH